MKFNIEGFSQEKLIEFKLSYRDALVLRWFVDFAPKMMSIEFNGQRYSWAKYQAILNDLPCLEITSTKTIQRIFDKFVECGIMDKIVTDDARHLTCFKLTVKYLSLIGNAQHTDVDSMDKTVQAKTKDTTAWTEMSNPLDNGVQAPRQNCPDNINKTLLLDSSTNTHIIPNPLKGHGNVNAVPVPQNAVRPNLKINVSTDARELAHQAWLTMIATRKISFTKFELAAIKAYAYSKPHLPPHEIDSCISLLEKWALEGKDIEDCLRQSLSTRTLIKPTMRIEHDSRKNRIYDPEQLNFIRQQQINQEKE